MTESEAWLKAANEYENNLTPIRFGQHTTGLCIWISLTRGVPKRKMRRQLRLFQRTGGDVWYGPPSNGKVTRELRATACGFLAAMADD